MAQSNNPVVWFEIYVRDIQRAKTFYEKVLEVEMQDLPVPAGAGPTKMIAFSMQQSGGGAAGALVEMKDAPVGAGGTIVYFTCEDCGKTARRVAGAGGMVFKEKTPIGPHGFMALATDTEGNMFGLHSMT